MDNQKEGRGFISIAIGPYYRYMAKLLAITYRLNSNCDDKLAIVTETDDKELVELYDIIIIENNKLESGYLYKLKLNEYTPFEETIFLDADQFIIDDVSLLWKYFINSDFGVTGINSFSYTGAKNFFSLEKVNKEFGIDCIPKFQGGYLLF